MTRPYTQRAPVKDLVDDPDRWTVRNVPAQVRDTAAQQAFARNITVGEWLSDLVRDAVAPATREPDLAVFKDRAAAFQSIVADCMCWFAGFEAAHVGKETWERPWTPERERLRDLNIALQNLLPASETEIPF